MLYQQTLKHDFENNQTHHPDNPALKTLEKKASLVHQQAEQIFYKGMITQMKKKSRDLFEQFASDPEELQKQLLKAQDKMLQSVLNTEDKADFNHRAEQMNFSLLHKAKIDYQKNLDFLKKNITGQEIQENLNLIGILFENVFLQNSNPKNWEIIDETHHNINSLKNETFENGRPLFNLQQKDKVNTTLNNVKLQALKNVFNQASLDEKLNISSLLSEDKWETKFKKNESLNVKDFLEPENYQKLKTYCSNVLKKFKDTKKNKDFIDDEIILENSVQETQIEEELENKFNRILGLKKESQNQNIQQVFDLRYNLHQAWENQKIQKEFYKSLIKKTDQVLQNEREVENNSSWNLIMKGLDKKSIPKENIPFVKDFLYREFIQNDLNPWQTFSSNHIPKLQTIIQNLNFLIPFLKDNNLQESTYETN